MKTFYTLSILIIMSILSFDVYAQTPLIKSDVDTFQSQSLTGYETFNNVVIFIRFQDEANYQAPFHADYYETMFNGVNTISVRDYYLEASYGKLAIDSLLFRDQQDLILYYTDIYDRSYYEPYSENNLIGYDEEDYTDRAVREHELLGRAVNYIDSLGVIDPSLDLDVNNDGDIDALTFMVSGEDNGWASLLWPHQWYLYTDYYTEFAPTINGLKAYTYTFNLLGDSVDYPVRTSVGVLAHETFHLLGAPDLYHYYSHSYIDNAGPWSLMDNAAKTPVHMLGYMKYQYGGWIDEVTTITTPGTYTLEPLKDSASNLYKFDTGYSNESVYFEFRYQEGFYESTLPSSGLLIYRVDSDHFGNQDGYSETDNGPGINEVFMFRPGIQDIIEPITFPSEVSNYGYAGDIYQAALSQFNAYQEANTSNEFLMFHSDGTLMNIQITNVVMNGKTLTFDISFDIQLNIGLEVGGYTLTPNDYLIDHDAFVYEAILTNVSQYTVYYTLDNTQATQLDELYQGVITFTSRVTYIHISVYDNDQNIFEDVFEILYVSTLESNHYPYGNNIYQAFYIPYIKDLKSLSLVFDSFFELEEEYDFLYITATGLELSYTGTQLQNQTIDLTQYNTGIWIEFITDEYLDDYYGFLAELDIEIIEAVNPSDFIQLQGDANLEIPYGILYEELSISILSPYDTRWTYTITGNVDVLTADTYTLTYDIFENDRLLYSLSRTVTVLEPVHVTLLPIEDFSLELGSEPYDFTPLIQVEHYNGLSYDIYIEETIDYLLTGHYDVFILVTDAFNFYTELSITVSIVDTISPRVYLIPNIDTIEIGTKYVDAGVEIIELNQYNLHTEGIVDTETVGVYTLTYRVTDASQNQKLMNRMVHVILPITPILSIQKTVTTYRIGDQVVIPSCDVLSHDIDCVTEYDVNIMNQVGQHPITYTVTYLGIQTTQIIYIFITDNNDVNNVLFIPKKMEDLL